MEGSILLAQDLTQRYIGSSYRCACWERYCGPKPAVDKFARHLGSQPQNLGTKFWVTATFPNETIGCHILRMVCRMFHIRLITVTFIWGANVKLAPQISAFDFGVKERFPNVVLELDADYENQ